MISLHDIPGGHLAIGHLPKLADKTEGDSVVFVAPFKCKLRSVEVVSNQNWVGVNSATNYNKLVCSTVISGVETAVGTISGSPSGTPVPANTPTSIYSPSTYPTLEADDLVVLSLGTVGAGTTAAPAMTAKVIYEGA